MTFAKGRGVRLEVANAFGSNKTVTEVTEADPPVVTSSAHGLAAKSVGYFTSVVGMPRLEGQVARILNPLTNSFELEDLDTTDYGNFTSGSFVPVSTWTTFSNATEINKAGGDANPLDVTVIMDEIQQQENGQLGAESVSVSARLETISNAAMSRIRNAARNQENCVFRLTYKDGNVRIFRGQPSLPTEQVATGQVGTMAFTVTLKQLFLEGAA
jgi:hypothetical protein